jgi:hypothetical protein
MGAQLLQLMADVFVEVLKGIEARWSQLRSDAYDPAHQRVIGTFAVESAAG